MNERTFQLMRELSEVNGIPGFEAQVATIVERELTSFCQVERDNLGSIICKHGKQGPKIMLAGHMDEIGFMVRRVTKEGFITFSPLGGWWDQVLLAQRVAVHGAHGPITGVIGSKPPHLLTGEERGKVYERKDMFIDVGARDEDDARDNLGIRIGDPIVPISPVERLANKRYVMGKAWDDRVGVGLMIEAMRAFKRKRHPNVLYGVGTTQEEVGCRGAQTAAQSIGPDAALILETGIAGDVPGIKEDESELELGKGVALYLLEGLMIPDVRFRDLVIRTCEEEKIPYQVSVLERGGTDGGRIHLHARGVPCAIIAVATRHIHCHSGIFHTDDFDTALKLVVALIERLDQKAVDGLRP